MNKLLYIFSKLSDGYEFNKGLYAAFSKLPSFHEFAYADKVAKVGRMEMNKELIDYIKKVQPSVIFMQYIDAGEVRMDTMQQIQQIPCVKKILIWTGDFYSETPPDYYYDYGKFCVSLFSNQTYINDFRNKGYEAHFLNHYHESAYKRISAEKIHPVTFIGSDFKDRKYQLTEFRNDIIDHVYKTYNNVGIFGERWGKYNARPVSREKSNLIYNQSKIALNISNMVSGRYTSDRLMHILGAGCFCLCHRYPDCEIDLGADGENVVYFENKEELTRLIDYFLIHESERQAIADRGHKNIKAIFGDQQLVDKISNIYSGDIK